MSISLAKQLGGCPQMSRSERKALATTQQLELPEIWLERKSHTTLLALYYRKNEVQQIQKEKPFRIRSSGQRRTHSCPRP